MASEDEIVVDDSEVREGMNGNDDVEDRAELSYGDDSAHDTDVEGDEARDTHDDEEDFADYDAQVFYDWSVLLCWARVVWTTCCMHRVLFCSALNGDCWVDDRACTSLLSQGSVASSERASIYSSALYRPNALHDVLQLLQDQAGDRVAEGQMQGDEEVDVVDRTEEPEADHAQLQMDGVREGEEEKKEEEEAPKENGTAAPAENGTDAKEGKSEKKEQEKQGSGKSGKGDKVGTLPGTLVARSSCCPAESWIPMCTYLLDLYVNSGTGKPVGSRTDANLSAEESLRTFTHPRACLYLNLVGANGSREGASRTQTFHRSGSSLGKSLVRCFLRPSSR
jgi:hypothetical protein